MVTNETMTETPQQMPIEPMADGPLIVAPGAPGAILQPAPTEEASSEPAGPGIEGETTIWEGHYSGRNFIGRILMGILLGAGWTVLAISHWNHNARSDQHNASFWVFLLGVIVGLYWLNLGYRFLRARRGHHYRLTTRRLFVTTGFFSRRVDQVELIRIKDIYIQQSMVGDWLGIGNVVIISSEQTLPKAYLLGIDEPRRVMDYIWHHMRLEQAQKTSRVNPV